jgi:biofilm PGA synthesis N-glycosyltransferase PgaC
VTAVFASSLGVVVYTLLGYPLVMAVIARIRPRAVRSDPGFLPSVSLIIAAHNEAEVIGSKLANTAALDYPAERLEVVVVADGCDDDTVDRARAFPDTKVLFEPERRGKLAAITRAAVHASGEVLVFSDANNHYSRGALRELVAPLADASVGVVTGRKQIVGGHERSLDGAEALYWRYESKLKEWESAAGSSAAVTGEILAFRREAHYSLPAGMLTEDFAQAMAAASQGWRVVYAPEAVSVERASATIADEATRRARIVTGACQTLMWLLPRLVLRQPRLAWQVVSHKGMRPIVPAALMALAASSFWLAPRRRTAGVAASAQLGFCLCAALGRRDAKHGRHRRWTYFPYYFLRMNGASVEGLIALARRRLDAAWTRVPRG